MSRAPELFTLAEVEIITETDNAIKVATPGDEFWLPLSQVTTIVRSKATYGSSITMTAWIAKKKGLI